MLARSPSPSLIKAANAPAAAAAGFRSAALADKQSACSECRLRTLCLPSDLSESELQQFGSLVFSYRKLSAGQALYRSGDAFGSVYLLRTGTIKTVILHEDGRAQVAGFYMSGEMFGLDGLACGRHASDAVALEDCSVCVVPYSELESLSRSTQAVQRHFYQTLASEVVRKQRMMLLLGSMRAEERVASFLLNLSERLTARGYSASDFVLRMTRDEIGSLLGMKLETVSRVFSRFQKDGLLRVEGRHVCIVNPDGLRALIGN